MTFNVNNVKLPEDPIDVEVTLLTMKGIPTFKRLFHS